MTIPRCTLPVLLVALACTVPASRAAGLDIHADAELADIGLPLYPGAVKRPQKEIDSAGFSFGLWGSAWGLKLDVLNYRSDAEVEDIAAFYREALARLGPLVDCTARRPGAASAPAPKKTAKDAPVSCGDDAIGAGGRLYKAGTESDQRIVAIKPLTRGVSFVLTRIQARGMD
jgi:hypothetical protein